ncbi:hypothetical protein NEIELOOT_01812, partial [Neisseria elongata subsp. glycolytica ATCC 29315]
MASMKQLQLPSRLMWLSYSLDCILAKVQRRKGEWDHLQQARVQ